MQNGSPLGLPSKKNTLVLPVVLVMLLVVSIVFGVWAFIGMSDYKSNTEKKSEDAVAKALLAQKTKLDAEFAEKAKLPFETYQASSEFGSFSINYPKNWETYVDSKISGGSSSIDGYAHPNFVPSITSDTAFALRFQVVDRQFDVEMKAFDGAVKNGTVTSSPIVLEKVPSAMSHKFTGLISPKRTGILYLLKLRDKTIKIWTESVTYSGDLDTIIKNLAYNP